MSGGVTRNYIHQFVLPELLWSRKWVSYHHVGFPFCTPNFGNQICPWRSNWLEFSKCVFGEKCCFAACVIVYLQCKHETKDKFYVYKSIHFGTTSCLINFSTRKCKNSELILKINLLRITLALPLIVFLPFCSVSVRLSNRGNEPGSGEAICRCHYLPVARQHIFNIMLRTVFARILCVVWHQNTAVNTLFLYYFDDIYVNLMMLWICIL